MSVLDIFKKKQKKESFEKPKEKKVSVASSVDQPTVVPSLPSKGLSKEQGLLVKPYFSEKFTLLREEQNKYIFEVHPRATKNEIKKLLENIYNVEILKINVLSAPQKVKKWRNKKSILRGNKKMIITLKEGQKIELGI